MNHAERRLAADPVVAAAISSRGLDIANLPWEQMESAAGEEVRLDGPQMPTVLLDDRGNAHLYWWRAAPECSVSYDLDGEGGILTIHNTTTPETMLDAMTDRTLSDIVDVAGAGQMRIVRAVNSKAFVSDPLDTRIQVEPLAQTADSL